MASAKIMNDKYSAKIRNTKKIRASGNIVLIIGMLLFYIIMTIKNTGEWLSLTNNFCTIFAFLVVFIMLYAKEYHVERAKQRMEELQKKADNLVNNKMNHQ